MRNKRLIASYEESDFSIVRLLNPETNFHLEGKNT